MLKISDIEKDKLTPMLSHYVEIKEEYPTDIVMFRVGDFFEAYFEDANIVSQICGFTLTKKTIGKKDKSEKQSEYSLKEEKISREEILNSQNLIPMSGVPHKNLDTYAQKMIDAGYRVVVVDQLEDPALAKGRMVKRGVVAIMSGMNRDGEFLTEYLNNFVAVITNCNNVYGMCFADVGTSDIFATSSSDIEDVVNEISKYKPGEIVVNSAVAKIIDTNVKNNLRMKTILTIDDAIFTEDTSPDQKALTGLINYINYTQKIDFVFSKEPVFYSINRYMSIDMYSRSNLELTENSADKTKNNTLLSVLDNCNTAMGSRLLRQWIDKPLQSEVAILERLSAVQEFVDTESILNSARESIIGILDISRIIGKLKMNRAIPRDLVNLREVLKRIPEIKGNVASLNSALAQKIYSDIEDLSPLCDLLESALLDNPSNDIRDAYVLRNGYNKELDTVRAMINDSNSFLAELEKRERNKTGIKNLRVSNTTGKCVIEVSKSNYDKIPDEYRIEKVLKNATRYITDETEKLQESLLSAIEHSRSIEIELYEDLKKKILAEHQRILRVSDAISLLDVLCSFAYVAIKNDYTVPEINNSGVIDIEAGRHPVVEQTSDGFIDNDTKLDLNKNSFMLITGPNMAGKSTYMRQTALIVLMAHLGSFVPAKKANIPITDKIFTRIGASDDISSGRSTYMVEMTEVKNILDNATKHSLILLDEVGRGTSTSDGLAIAQAISEYIYEEIGCKTLFATHYHELISLESKYPLLKNFHMSVDRDGDELIFSRKLLPGGLSESYGIDVAKLAGLPEKVINRARTILSTSNKVGPVFVRENKEEASFEGVVENLIDELSNSRDVLEGNESQTRWCLIDPMITNGWGYSRNDVITEYSLENSTNHKHDRIDYVVQMDNKPKMLIEAKSLGSDLYSNYSQLKSYFERILEKYEYEQNELIGVLTDGDKYLFYTNEFVENAMDPVPFLSVQISLAEDYELEDLAKFHKLIVKNFVAIENSGGYEFGVSYRIDSIERALAYFEMQGMKAKIDNVYINGRIVRISNLKSLYRELLRLADINFPGLLYNLAVESDKRNNGKISSTKFSLNHINSSEIVIKTSKGYIYATLPSTNSGIIDRIVNIARISKLGVHNILISFSRD